MLCVLSINNPNIVNWILSIYTQFDHGYLASVMDIMAMENFICTKTMGCKFDSESNIDVSVSNENENITMKVWTTKEILF
jgi:hypothetical protein